MNKRGLKIDWFLVSILDHFFSLFASQRAPNRLQNAPKMVPKGVHSLAETCFFTDLVPKCSQMAPRTQKVTILESKMTSQGSKIVPQTTSGDQKVFPKRYFITDFQELSTNIEIHNITLTLRFTLHTSHVRLSNFALRTLHFTLPTSVPKTICYHRLPTNFNKYRNR